MPTRNARLASLLPLAFAALWGPTPATGEEGPDTLADTSLENLLNVKVYGASKFSQRALEAPATVTVVTAADIRTFGYRTLADVLRSIRGLYVSYDRSYPFLGVHGFSRPGDFNSRVLLLLDGTRINDNLYDTATIGLDFPLDVDLIERVEFVPGPGSSLYGSNAFFGVVNVVTRQGRDVQNAELSGAAASFGTDRERLSLGRRFENGLDVLLSATRHDSNGRDRYFPEYDAPETNFGRAEGLDGERHGSGFARFGYGGWSLEAVFGERDKDIPTGQYDTLFNTAGTRTRDRKTHVTLEYLTALPNHSELSTRVFYGHYLYDGTYAYPGDLNVDRARGQWWGGEAKLFSAAFAGHKLVLGSEFQINFRQDQTNFDRFSGQIGLDDHRSGDRYGFYLQDEITLLDSLKFNGGVRYDHYNTFGGTVNPRLALIYQPAPETALKLAYGTAFRAPNAYELYYAAPSPGGQSPNPELGPEHIETYELSVETHAAGWLLTGALFRYHIDQEIEQVRLSTGDLLIYRNVGHLHIDGGTAEIERIWNNGIRLRASYSGQYAEEAGIGRWLSNSPKHLVKFNLSAPVYGDALRLGWESQYVADRKTYTADRADGYFLTNLTLTAQKLVPGLEISASVYNLFDERYADPVGDFHRQDRIEQDGRHFRVKLTARF
jgi:outer membrane receptor protein involved in Fe transport